MIIDPIKYIRQRLHRGDNITSRSLCKGVVFVGFIAVYLWICSSVTASEGGRVKKRDTNADGVIDQVAEFDHQGVMVLLEIDDNGDGLMDTFQYYVGGEMVRLEKNLDTAPGVDLRDYFKNGKKIRQECLDDKGHIFQEIYLDAAGRPIEIREDTTTDQLMDTVYTIEEEQITRITRDENDDGATNVVELYRNGKLVETRRDANGDGKVEEQLLFNEEGILDRRHLDTDQDGDLDMLEIFRSGLTHMQQWDQNQDGLHERVAFFEKGDMVRIEEDSDMDGVRETVVVYRFGKPFVQTTDMNQDGKEELRIFYNTAGETERIEKDVSMDGRMDTFQRYKNNRLMFVEKDTNADGEIDAKISYDANRQKNALMDQDYDGRFETTHWYDRPPWTRVTEMDSDGSGNADVRSYYKNDILRRRETLKKGLHLVELRENFNEQGFLVNSLEDRDADGRWDISWYYNAQGNVERAEKDANADDRVDVWYYYEGGRLSLVSEDANGDGQPDIWEVYDASESMIQRKKDLDFDGVADIEETF